MQKVRADFAARVTEGEQQISTCYCLEAANAVAFNRAQASAPPPSGVTVIATIPDADRHDRRRHACKRRCYSAADALVGWVLAGL
jgi:hypothetical protein